MARVPQVRDHQARTVETSENRITIRETLDGLGIYNPARRNIVLILFLMLWLTGWAFGEYFALSQILRGGNVFGSLFLLVWASFWTLGGLFAVRVLLWNVFGSERLFITGGVLVHSRGFGPFRRKRVHPLAEVGGFRANLKGDPAANAIPLSSIEYVAGGAARSFGVGMTREEAEASLAAIRRALPFDAPPEAPGGGPAARNDTPMFFYLSKLFWIVVQPINLIGILVLAGIVLALARFRWSGIALSFAGFLVLALGAWSSLGAVLLHPLEDRFTRPDPAPQAVAGIIVLGGGFEGGVNLVRGGYELNASGDRFVEAAILARRYPDARVVVTGGAGTLLLAGEGDGDTAPKLLTALGVAPGRLVLETRARNTQENARFTRELVEPRPGETWLLVTSAFHMPRSVGLFRKAGFEIVPWPTDYQTAGTETFGLAQDNAMDSLRNLALAIREWIGLAAYRATGRIDRILPG